MAKEKILSGLPKGIQTPSKEDNDDLKIDVICGSLASLIYGEKSVDSPDALRNLLSREPKIYSIISSSVSESTENITKSIKDNIKIVKDNVSESLLNQTNTLTSSITSLGETISMSFDVLNANNDAFVEKILENIPQQNKENNSTVIDNKTLEFVSNVERQFSLLIQSLISHQKEFNNVLETSLNKLENIDYKLKLDVNVDGNNDIVNLLSNIKNVNISDLDAASIQSKNIVGALNNIINVISKLNEVDGNAKIDVNNINAILDERETINKIVDNLSNFELNQLQAKDIQAKEIIASINAISNVISKLNEVDGNAKIDVDNINAILDERETINKIVDSLSNFELTQLQAKDIQAKEIIASINAISKVISKLNSIKESEDIDMTKIQKILDQGDAIYYISDELKKFTNVNIELSNSEKTITNISSIVEVLLGLDKNLSKINNVLEKNTPDFSNVKKLSSAIRKLDVKDLIDELNSAFPKDKNINFDVKNIEKLSKSLDILTKFLSLNEIDKVIETSSRKLRKFRKQMFKIGSVYIESVNTLINQLNSNAFTVLDKEKTESIKRTFSVIDYITSFSTDEDKLDELADTFDYLSYIIENNLNDFLNTLKDEEFVKKINYIINSKLIDDVIIITENLGKLNEVILPMKTLLSMTIKLAIINKQTEIIGNLIKTISSIENVENAANNLKTINEKILTKLTVKSSENLGELFVSFLNIYNISKKINFDKLLESTTSLIEILKLFKNVKVNKDIDKIGVICSGLSKTMIYFGLVAPFVPLAKIGLLGLKLCINNILEVLEQLKGADISKIQGIMTDFTKIVVMSGAMLIAGALFMSYIKIPDLIAFTVCLGTFVASTVFAYTKSIKDIKDSIGISKDFTLLLTLSGAILIAGGLFMQYINIVDLFSFAVTLGTFIFMISKALSIAQTTDAFKNAQDFGMLIAISGGILIAGALFMKVINIGDLIAFTATLGVFILAVSYAYSIPMRIAKEFSGLNPFDAAEEFALLIAVSGGILIAGGLFMKVINMDDLLNFTLTLGGFIGAVCLAYSIPSIIAKICTINPIENAKDFAILVAVSGAILIAGGLFMKVINVVDLLIFTATLGAFILAVSYAYSIPSKTGLEPMRNAKEFTLLVAVSGAILIAGALFMKIINTADLITFTVTLGAFIFAVCGAYGRAAKMMKKSIPNAYALAVLTAIAGATLLIGGYLIMENPGLDVNVMIFAGILIAYIGAMGVITWLLSKVGAKIAIGLAAIGGILLITYGATEVIEAIKKAVGKGGANYWLTLLEGLGSIALLITAVGAIAFAAGLLVMGPQALLFAAGAAAMATISGIAILAAGAVKNVASAMKDINSVKNFDGKGIISNLKEFIKIVDALEPLSDKAWMITKVSLAMTSMGIMMSVLSNAVKNYSSLTVPEFDVNGHSTGKYIKLNNTHFKEAADNVKTIIQTLGKAIIDSYNSAPAGMFESSGFLGLGDTPFAKVSKSMSTMGPMLTTLAEAVKDYASLRIPTYDKNGNKNGTRALISKDFINAALNVGLLVSCLGGAIIDTYNKVESDSATKGMFDASGWLGKGDSKFAKVTNSLTTMGPMISSIADGVKKYADLRIPIFDSTGKESGSREMTKTDFENASKNVGLIVSTLGQSIMDIYAKNPIMFMLDNEANPMLKIAQACTEMGNMIGSIAEGVYKYATLEVPEFDASGKKTGNMIKMGKEHFTEAANTITEIITTMGNGIMGAFHKYPEWFKPQKVMTKKGGWFEADEFKETDPIFIKVIGGCSQMGNLVATIGDSVLKFASKQIPEIVNGKPTGNYIQLKNSDLTNATKNITDIITSLGNAMINIGDSKMYKSGGFSKNSIDNIKNAISTMINTVSEASQVLKQVNELNPGIISGGIENITELLLKLATIHNLIYYDGDKYPSNNIIGWTHGITFAKEIDYSSNNHRNKITKSLIDIKKSTNDIIKINNELYNKLSTSQVLNTETVIQMCSSLSLIKTKIDEMFSENTSSVGNTSIFGNIFSLSDENNVNKKFKAYLNNIDDFIDLGDRTSGNIMFGWQQIALGIGIINDAVNLIAEEGNNNLKEHVDSLDKYITKINTLDMSKVNSLTNLVNSLNLLAFKMGNLDNFTEALSQKLSSVLKELTDQLKEADASITKARKLQDSRKKAIEESVNKIKEIMGQTLNVEISKKDENDTSGNGSAAAPPSQQTNNTSSSSSQEQIPTGQIDSPETTGNRTEEQGKRAKQSSAANVSTEVAKAISTVFGSGVKAKINNKEVILTT